MDGPLAVGWAELELAEARQRIAIGAAAWALEQKASKPGTKLAERAVGLMTDPPAELRAALAERTDRHDEAIALYREAGLPDEALRLSRARGDDPDRSLALALEIDAPQRETLERLARLVRDLRALAPDQLTDAERDHLQRTVKERLARR